MENTELIKKWTDFSKQQLIFHDELLIDYKKIREENVKFQARIKELESQLKSWRDWARDEMEKGPAESEIPEFNDEIAEWDTLTDEEKESEIKQTAAQKMVEDEIEKLRREK